eukprot:1678028-Rhodomonas_salina.3
MRRDLDGLEREGERGQRALVQRLERREPAEQRPEDVRRDVAQQRRRELLVCGSARTQTPVSAPADSTFQRQQTPVSQRGKATARADAESGLET